MDFKTFGFNIVKVNRGLRQEDVYQIYNINCLLPKAKGANPIFTQKQILAVCCH